MLRIEFQPELQQLFKLADLPPSSTLLQNKTLKKAYPELLKQFLHFRASNVPEREYSGIRNEIEENLLPEINKLTNSNLTEEEYKSLNAFAATMSLLRAGIYLTYLLNGYLKDVAFYFEAVKASLDDAQKFSSCVPNNPYLGKDYPELFSNITKLFGTVNIINTKETPNIQAIGTNTNDYKMHLDVIDMVLAGSTPLNYRIGNVINLINSLFRKHSLLDTPISSSLEIAQRLKLLLEKLQPLMFEYYSAAALAAMAKDARELIYTHYFLHFYTLCQNVAFYFYRIALDNKYAGNHQERKELLSNALQMLRLMQSDSHQGIYQQFARSQGYAGTLKSEIEAQLKLTIAAIIKAEQLRTQQMKAEEITQNKVKEYNKNFKSILSELAVVFPPIERKRKKRQLTSWHFSDSESDSEVSNESMERSLVETPAQTIPFESISLKQHLNELLAARNDRNSKKEAEKLLDLIDFHQLIAIRRFSSARYDDQTQAIAALRSCYEFSTQLKRVLDQFDSKEFEDIKLAHNHLLQYVNNVYSNVMRKYTDLHKKLSQLREDKIREMGEKFYQVNPEKMSKRATEFWQVYYNLQRLIKLSPHSASPQKESIKSSANSSSKLPTPTGSRDHYLQFRSECREYFKGLFFSPGQSGAPNADLYLKALRDRTLRRSNSESVLEVNPLQTDSLKKYKLT